MSAILPVNITNSQTSINVQDTSTLPSAGVVTIESETIAYTNLTDRSLLGCTRGFNGSSAATHAKGKALTVISTGIPAAALSGATVSPDASLYTTTGVIDVSITAITAINGPTKPFDQQKIVFRLTQDSTGYAVTFNTGVGNFEFGTTIASFTASAASKVDYVGVVYNASREKWDIVSVSQGF